jgi:Arc/MetJ-type ribon-helix-helix transcriptional regulator
MDIPLHPDIERFLLEQLATGDYVSPDEVVTEALFLLWQREQGLGAGVPACRADG